MSHENQTTSPLTTPPDNREVVLEASNITKRFPGVLANNNVNLKLHKGEILALLGENGAGKSTLMNIIYGLYHQDEGEIRLKGQEARFASPREAIHSGIGMVHQHFQLVEVMDVGENVVLGEERETPRWFSLFSFIFMAFMTYFAAKLILDYPHPLTYATFSFAIITFLLPWFLATRLSAIGSRPFDFLIDYFSNNNDQKQHRKRYDRSKWQNILTMNLQIVALVILLVIASNSTAFSDVEVFTALVGMILFAGSGYTIFSILTNNNYGKLLEQQLSNSLSFSNKNLLSFLSILLISAISICATLLSWFIFWIFSDSSSINDTFEFLTLLTITVPVSAVYASVLAFLLSFVFENWKHVSTGGRVLWGIAWRVSLILVALWVGGLAQRISEMGMITLLLQNDVPFDGAIDDAERPISIAFWNEGEQNPYIKGGVSGQTELSINWNARIDNAGDYDAQVDTLLAEIDDKFSYEATYENITPTYRTQAHVEGYRGINASIRNSIETLPTDIQDVVISILLISLLGYAIVSWRGSQHFSALLTPLDSISLLVISLLFFYQIWTSSEDISNGIRLVIMIAGIIITIGIYAYTYLKRQTDPDRIRATSPLDTIIDALITFIYTLFSVRNSRVADEQVHELSRQYGLEVDPTAIVEKLPVGLQQRVEIIKALYRKADILILDEPTAVLTPQEGKELFKIMRDLASQGVSIIFITHKLKEVFEVATNIVVMRNGEVVGTTTPSEATESSLAAMMVGREVLLRVEKEDAQPTGNVLHVEDLHAIDDRGAVALNGVSFGVEAGEVLGIAGVQGNGQTELVEVLTGLRPMEAGGVELLGQELKPQRHPDANPLQRLIATLLDLSVLGLLTIIVSYFWSYFSQETETFKVLSLQSLLIFVVLDAVYTLGSWQLWGLTFGKFAMSLQIVHAEDDSHPTLPAFIQRYLLQTLMRYSIVGYPLVAAFRAFSTPAGGQDSEQKSSNYLAKAWYDELPTINCRVVNRIAITSRKIKDLRTGHIPEDRLRFGMVKPFSVTENLILNDYYESPHSESPSFLQLPLLSTSYAVVMAAFFAIIGYGWLRVWNTTLWSKLLDAFNVPSEWRGVPLERSLSTLQKAYLDDPLLLSLIILVGMTLLTGLVAYMLTKIVFRFISDPYSFIPPLGIVVIVFVGLAFTDGVLGRIWASFNDRLLSATISMTSDFLDIFSGFNYSTEINKVMWGVLSLAFLITSGVIYSWFREATKTSPALMTIKQNLRQNRIGQFIEMQNAHGLTLNVQNSVGYADRLIDEYDIRTPSALTSGGSLSGGNQQKVVVAREFSREPLLLIAAQPTRGIDVGSIEFIHKRIIQQRDKGAAVLLVSAELDEIMSLSDRIAVMYKGEVIKVLDAKQATREELGLLMAGVVK